MTAANCQFGKMSVKVITRIVVNRMTGSNNPNDSADEPTLRQAERALHASGRHAVRLGSEKTERCRQR